MQYHEIGKTGMKVSSLSFGAVFTAIEAGINFIDVSPYYGHYKAETVLGKALRDLPRHRERVRKPGTTEHRLHRPDKRARHRVCRPGPGGERNPAGTVESVLNFCHYCLCDDKLAEPGKVFRNAVSESG